MSRFRVPPTPQRLVGAVSPNTGETRTARPARQSEAKVIALCDPTVQSIIGCSVLLVARFTSSLRLFYIFQGSQGSEVEGGSTPPIRLRVDKGVFCRCGGRMVNLSRQTANKN